MSTDGHRDGSQVDWYRAFFDGNAAAGAGGAMFWILTPDAHRGYGVTYSTPRDQALLREVSRAAQVFAELQSADLPAYLQESSRHVVPRQFAWSRSLVDPAVQPQIVVRDDRSVLYQFKPQMATAQRFEKIGGGPGYIWGYGSGFVEYTVPERADRRRVSEIIVRAHIRPVLPNDAPAGFGNTRVTLRVNGWNGGSRLVSAAEPFPGESSSSQSSSSQSISSQSIIQEWRLTGLRLRLHAMRGLPLTIRFAVTPDADWPYGINISNWPDGYDPHDARPVEVELRH